MNATDTVEVPSGILHLFFFLREGIAVDCLSECYGFTGGLEDCAVQRLHRTPMLTLTFKNSTAHVNFPDLRQLQTPSALVNFVHWMWRSFVTDTLLWPPVSLILAANDTGCLAL